MSGSSRAGFGITITAVDQASKSIDAINRRIREMQAPAERLQKSFNKLADTTGLNKVAEGFKNVGRETFQAFENVGRLGGVLGIVTGAGVIAGIAKLTSEWSKAGSQLGFASQRAGISAQRLAELQGAARLAGSSAEALTGGIRSLTDNLTNAAAGRSTEAILAFNYLGIAIRTTDGHLRTANDVLPQVADKIAAIKNPTIQAQLATMLFGGAAEDLLPFLRRGAAGIEDYTAKARQYGVINDRATEAANELRERQAELTLATQGLGNTIAEKLAPVLGPMLLDLATWIRNNRELVATDVAGWAASAASGIGSVLRSLESMGEYLAKHPRIAGFVLGAAAGSRFGPAGAVIGGIGGSLLPGDVTSDDPNSPLYIPRGAAPVPGGPGQANPPNGVPRVGPTFGPQSSLNPQQRQQNIAAARAFFMSQGWSPAQTAGILANANAESGFNPNASGDNGTSFGLFQWHADRLARFRQFAGHDIGQSTMDEQLKFAQYELTGPESRAGAALHGATTPQDAAAAFSTNFERPRDAYGEAQRRAAAASEFVAPPAPVASAAPAQTETTVRGSANVNIKLDGFPAGTRTTATTDGNLFAPPRVETAMASPT